MTAVLGLSAYFHDSAAAIVVDGRIVAAAQEERFTRVKQESSFPTAALQYCLQEANLSPSDIELVAFYEKPLLKFDRILETHLAAAPRGLRAFLHTMPLWLRRKLYLPGEIRRQLDKAYNRRVVFARHHHSHAASAFYPAPFDNAAVLTVDGVGEWATAAWGVGCDKELSLRQELHFPHSLGLLYSAITAYCGFRVNSGEYKLMGLAPYGQPVYASLIREHLLTAAADGSFKLNIKFFGYAGGLQMTSSHFHKLLGAPPRRPGQPLKDLHRNLAASVQLVLEEQLLKIVRHVHQQSGGMKNLCLAGGVALNCVANRRIFDEGPFEKIWIQPAAGDAGGALGAALFAWCGLLQRPLHKTPPGEDAMQGALLGPAFNRSQIRQALQQHKAVFHEFDDEAKLMREVASLLAAQRVVGWFQGRMEFGPRALGSRSILADPRDEAMSEMLNTRIKRREPFRPFAPAVLSEHAAGCFDGIQPPNRYMLLTNPVTDAALLPAITHIDGTARVQKVDSAANPRFRDLLQQFHAQTGCPALVNTSFNVRGEPIVCTPEDALRCFAGTEIDALILGDFMLLRREQPADFFVNVDGAFSDEPGVLPATIPPGIPLVEIESQPGALAMTGALASFFLALLMAAALIAWRLHHPAPVYVAAGVCIAAGALFAFIPRLRLPAYRGWLWLNYPLAWLISHAQLVAVFYLVLTPTALIRRVFRQPQISRSDGWHDCDPPDTDDHFRQY